MIPEYRKQTNLFVGTGLILSFGSVALDDQGLGVLPVLAMRGAGFLLVIAGCFAYAQAKGHSRWWGLLGMLNLVGLVVLICFPDRRKNYKGDFENAETIFE